MFAGLVVPALVPVYRINATSLYDAGLQHGRLARDRIVGWLGTDEMMGLRNFTADARGLAAFVKLKDDNRRGFPALARELEGIAAGAAVPVDDVWRATLINELESIRSPGPPARGSARAGHCSDIYSRASGDFHGHNEDWPGPISRFWHWLALHAVPNAAGAPPDFGSCAGLAYPGSLVGWAATWNAHGMYLTQNSLFPLRVLPSGLASAFVQRHALCGLGPSAGMDEVVTALRAPYGGVRHWSSGASVNLVSLRESRMANVEVHEWQSSVFEVLRGANYSHFNMYKHMSNNTIDAPDASTEHRQARINALPVAKSVGDVRAAVSDTQDRAFPIYRNMTLASLVLDADTAQLDVWCCGSAPSSGAPAEHSWNLRRFFGATE